MYVSIPDAEDVTPCALHSKDVLTGDQGCPTPKTSKKAHPRDPQERLRGKEKGTLCSLGRKVCKTSKREGMRPGSRAWQKIRYSLRRKK